MFSLRYVCIMSVCMCVWGPDQLYDLIKLNNVFYLCNLGQKETSIPSTCFTVFNVFDAIGTHILVER